ncbi:recombinase family protein [Methylobacterium sp. J-001]|uniref:recombinase family protein n=1 Tax=Methylobacterium sp. J-001 TaxID=2836609 RepID=UPI001FBB6535|nr:recombinase family protein [Methylobacterium sp. J-001]MCJ2117003.1 recombinase family protein [Methylobacterium sp. J-001]
MERWGTQAAEAKPALAFSYLRLSSKRQANADDRKKYRDGFRRQVDLRDRYLAQNPHLTLDTRLNLHDIGVSGFRGANAVNGQLGLFLAEIEAGRIPRGSYLLVESLDRMSRQQVNRALAVLLAIVNAGIVVVSLVDKQEFREDAPADQFLISIMSLSRAHEESVMKSFRLRETWERKRGKASTERLTDRVPAWLTVIDGKIGPNGRRPDVVREIFGYLADGWGRDRIAALLNRRGEEPWGHGARWHGGTVQKLTDSRAVIGEFQPHRLIYVERKGAMVPRRVPVGDPIADYYPRVVDEDLWARARGVAVKRRLGKAPNAGGRLGTVVSNLFGMVATCGSCGSAMNFRDRGPRSHTVLRCSAERGGDCHNAYRVPYQDTENAILSWLVRLDLSGGVPGERAKIDEAIRTKVARRDSLLSEGDEVAARIGAGSRFGARAIARIEAELAEIEPEIVTLKDRLIALDAAGRRDEREMAVAALLGFDEGDLDPDEARERRFALRSRIRQVIRESFTSMRCMPDGHVEIGTIDGRHHLFRDGYWWCEEAIYWVPWAGSMFGMGHYATKAELARRRAWLDEAEKVNEPRRRAAGMKGV